MTCLVSAFVTSVLIVGVTLRWFNPLRETVNAYKRLALVQTQALNASAHVVEDLLNRTAGMLYCDRCGELVERGQLALVSNGEHGILIGHSACYPEVPDVPE